MPFQIVRNDITKMPVDAIVNAANESLLGGGGVDGAIHRSAGPKLLAECATLGGCPTGQAKATAGYDLPCRYVIHTVGPVWRGGGEGERGLLESCYRNSLALAAQLGCETVAFPLISAGAYGYPKEEALQVAVGQIAAFLLEHDMTVYLVVFDRDSFRISGRLQAGIREYIGQEYVEAHTDPGEGRRRALFQQKAAPLPQADLLAPSAAMPAAGQRLPELALDESFSQMLLRKIDEKGLTDAACYKRANIDRKLFSKIRKDPRYRPSKPTALAFAVALELTLEETRELLEKAGYALSHSFKLDLIVEYFIKEGNYDIFQINEALFEFDQVLLGG